MLRQPLLPLLVAAVAVLPAAVQARTFTLPSVKSADGLAFLAKFSFPASHAGADSGSLRLRLRATEAYMLAAVYSSKLASWPLAIDGACDFACKLDAAVNYTTLPLAKSAAQPTLWELPIKSPAPRFFYVALLNSRGGAASAEDVSVQFTTADGGQLGVAQAALPMLYTVGVALWTAALAIQLLSFRSLLSGRALHPVLRTHTLSLVFMWVALACQAIYWQLQARDGLSSVILLAVAAVCSSFSTVLFIALVLSVAGGYGVSTASVPHRRRLLAVLALVLLLHSALLLWGQSLSDSAAVFSIYASPPGVALVFVYVVIALWLAATVLHSFVQERDAGKRRFYVRFAAVYFTFFALLPLLVLVDSLMPAPVRLLATSATLFAAQLLCYPALGFVLRERTRDIFELSEVSLLDHDDYISAVEY